MNKRIIPFVILLFVIVVPTTVLLYVNLYKIYILPETGKTEIKVLSGEVSCDQATLKIDWNKVKINIVSEKDNMEAINQSALVPQVVNEKANWTYNYESGNNIKALFVTSIDNYSIPCRGKVVATNCASNPSCSCGESGGNTAYTSCDVSKTNSINGLNFNFREMAPEKSPTIIFEGSLSCKSTIKSNQSAKVWLNYLNANGVEYKIYSNVNDGSIWRSYAQHLSELKGIWLEPGTSCQGTVSCGNNIPKGCECKKDGTTVRYSCTDITTDEVVTIKNLDFRTE